MLSMVVFGHCINDRVHLGVRSFLTFLFIIFYALFLFSFYVFSQMFTPIQQSTAWPTLLRGLGHYQA